MKTFRLAVASAVVTLVLLLTTVTGFAGPVQQGGAAGPSGSLPPHVVVAEKMDVSPPLRSLPPGPSVPRVERDPLWWHRLPGGLETDIDETVQRAVGPNVMPPPLQNFDGTNNVNGVYPPDTEGDVGPNHYVQWVNSSIQIFSKTGASLYGPANGNTLWSGFGGPCETTNDGDPIALYDPIADRWLMSQFGNVFTNGPFYQCIAVSQTADPLGSWYRYAYQTSTNKLNDYPKFGVWPDGYYMSANLFFVPGFAWAGEGAYVYERTKMLVGDPTAQLIFFELPPSAWGGALPSDLDGQHLPPAGAPNVFVEVVDGAWDPVNWPNDALLVRKFHVDWVTPANSTYPATPVELSVAAFDGLLCNFGLCIPQPGTTRLLDVLADRMMYRLQYRNFGDHDALVVNHTVDVGTNLAGIRWYELRDLWGATPTIYQQATYAPADGLHRWMGSIAQDHVGNMALGFSTSNGTAPNYPSIHYTGRLVTDPLGQMPQGEGVIIAGTGSQTGTAGRWGDYSMMAVDPVDDCTFWYTTEYLQVTGGATWRTRIASFRFPSCVNPTSVEVSSVSAVTAVAAYAPLALVGIVALAALAVVMRRRHA